MAPAVTQRGGAAWGQTIYYPYLHASRYGRGVCLDVRAESPRYDSREFEGIPLLESVATFDPETREVTVFAVNRSQEAPLEVEIDVRAMGEMEAVEHLVLDGDPKAKNTSAQPQCVQPRRAKVDGVRGERLRVELPVLSWNVLRLRRP